MILTLITIGLLLVGFIIAFISSYFDLEGLEVFGTILSAFSVICLLCEGAIILSMNLPVKEEARRIAYTQRRETIVAELNLEHWYPTAEVYKAICEYNTEIELQYYYYNSSWFNWFASRAIAEQPTIELPER